jgi:3-hydroxyisobutyrate dehydrogenase-like beta-hydroxyacid dehydrogenase
MVTIGIVGVGKIGMPISENLIKSGYRVVGWRRSSLADFEKIGGVPARSAADIGAQADAAKRKSGATDAATFWVAASRT